MSALITAQMNAILKQQQDALALLNKQAAAAVTAAAEAKRLADEATADAIANPKEYQNAKMVRIGFFDGSKQFFHISNIKIITYNGVDIAPICTYKQSSRYDGQSAGLLRDILIDRTTTPSFCHTLNNANEYIEIDFLKVYSIKQIIIENRYDSNAVRDRIINAQFQVFTDGEKTPSYLTDKVTAGAQFYYIQGNSRTVFTGQPSVVAKKVDPTDPCNAPNLLREKPSLASACACQKASSDFSDQVRIYNTANDQYQVDLQYYNTLQQDKNDYDKKINTYKSWGDKMNQLQTEQLPFKECQGRYFYTTDQWEYTCVKDYGLGWEYVKGSDTMVGCGLNSKGKCKRTNAQLIKELNDSGYKLWAPPNFAAPKQPTAPASAPITCCSQSFDNIQAGAGGKVVIQGVSQSCKTEINNQIEKALKPDLSIATKEGTNTTASKNVTDNTPPPPPPPEQQPSEETSNGTYVVAGGVAAVVVIGIIIYAMKASAATAAAAPKLT